MENIGSLRQGMKIKSTTMMTQYHYTETALPVEYFKYLGREWRLFKRTPGHNASWYFLIERGGRRFTTSLKTSALQAAIASAKLLIDGAQQNKLEKIRAILGGRDERDTREFCSIDKYLQLYENTPNGDTSTRSRHHFVLAFRRLIERADDPPTRMDQLGKLFKAARARANAALEAAKDNADKMRIQRSFNSEISNAASVISQTAVYFLKDHCTLPDFTALRQDIKFLKFADAKKTVDQYRPPSQAVRDATIKSWVDLPRNEFLAVGLALACGMRKGEMKGKRVFVDGEYIWQGAADWNWFETHGDNLWCVGKGDFKDGTNLLRVQVLNPFWKIIIERCAREGWEREGLVLTGNRSEFDKNISEWMKGLGWQTRLHLHALRAWAGSLVFMRYGIRSASSFCRHSDEQTTREHYGWLKDEWHAGDTAVTIAGQPVEWVRANGG